MRLSPSSLFGIEILFWENWIYQVKLFTCVRTFILDETESGRGERNKTMVDTTAREHLPKMSYHQNKRECWTPDSGSGIKQVVRDGGRKRMEGSRRMGSRKQKSRGVTNKIRGGKKKITGLRIPERWWKTRWGGETKRDQGKLKKRNYSA